MLGRLVFFLCRVVDFLSVCVDCLFILVFKFSLCLLYLFKVIVIQNWMFFLYVSSENCRKLLPSVQVFISFELTAVGAIIFNNNSAVSLYLQRIKLHLTSIKLPSYKSNLIRLSE